MGGVGGEVSAQGGVFRGRDNEPWHREVPVAEEERSPSRGLTPGDRTRRPESLPVHAFHQMREGDGLGGGGLVAGLLGFAFRRL